MAQLIMPNVGEGVTEGTVVRWIKHEGDTVTLDEPIVEVETDKAVVEIPSPVAGTLTRLLVSEGEVVPIGTLLAEFGEVSGASESRREDAAAAPTAAGSPASVPAAAVNAGEGSRRSTAGFANGAARGSERRVRQFSPVVSRLAAEHNIDLSQVLGTGIDGRVTRQDVMRYLENPSAYSAPPPSSAGVVGVTASHGRSSAQPPPEEAHRAEEGAPEPLSATRRTIARRMLESHQTIPVAWMVVEADVTGLVALREQQKAEFERGEGVKLTYMPFFVQAIVGALKKHRRLNATYTDEGVTVHSRFDMGIAVATEHGLVVPVVRNAGDLSIAGLARQIDDLGRRAQARKLKVEEMQAATLTIDNTGSFGSVMSQPIVPVGQVAIITTEAVRRELRPIEDGAFAVRSVMNLCISFDHRALDGADAGAFMRDVRLRLEAYRADQPIS